MNSMEKQRIQAAYDRAGLIAQLASRGFYVIGEAWRGRPCGQPPGDPNQPEPITLDDRPPRP